MKTRIFLLAILLLTLASCDKFLDPYPNGDRSEEDIWQYQEMVQGLVGQCYDNMPRNYDNNEGVYLDGATDDAVITSSTNTLRRMATGSLTTDQDPFQTYWERDYRSINLVNKFLQNRKGYNTKFVLVSHYNDLVKNRLQGEAFALRAWFQWDLLQKFGGKGTNGVMLGFPIITEPLDYTSDVNLARNTYDECIAQIIADCDSAYKYLPIAHRDYLYPANSPDLVYAGGKYWGRFDGITTRAIKAMVYLTWASPRFNPSNIVARWDSAASNAAKVMNFKRNKDNVNNGFKEANAVNWFDPNFPGIVISARFNDKNDAMERTFYPEGFQGDGAIGASQDLVNSFGMANGRPITDPLSLYDPTKPYLNRDPRFYSSIFYNKAEARKSPTVLMYTFENWSNGGKDAAGLKSKNSLTNYHIKKFVYMGLNWSDVSINRQPHSKFFIRWAHMVLTFAEAANHVTHNPNSLLYGYTPKQAINYLRTRKTYDGASMTFGADAYLTQVANAGEAPFDALVKNERRIETCFEGMRFYDLRRWSTDATWQSVINQPVHGALITLNADNTTFTYNLNNVVETRSFQSPWLPIPYKEMLRMSNLVQNEGWDNWN